VINLKSKKKQKIVHALFFLVLFFIGNYYLANLINNKVNNEINSYTLPNVDILRTSGHWNLAPFVIDDSGEGDYTWEDASAETWCSGSGTFEEPYLIENVTIDGGNLGNCITINNSLKYFRIENCTVFNSGSYAGIHLDHAGNGSLINNNCSFNNKYGIVLSNSDNSTVSGNTANNNSYIGMSISNSDNTTISGNTANNNSFIGISLYYSDNSTVSGNTANNNTKNGIFIIYSDNTTISGNTANNNSYYGIRLYYSNHTTVSGNTANNNSYYGINLSYSNHNTVSGNTANNNQHNGIYLYYSNNNTLSGNIVDKNRILGFLITSSDYNLIYKNYFYDNGINARNTGTDNKWDNGVIGNYWDDYDGIDANDDGIGDTPYKIPGTPGNQDNFPIWDDGDDIGAPVITIIFPLPDSVFGLVAPNYNISIDDLKLDTIWYTLDGGLTNYTVTALTGTFNQTAWEALSEGSLTIRFYANDTAGNIGFTDVEVIIEIPEDLPIISFGNYYILFMFITILSFIILEKRKKK
jgi:parallel beta-helix repeat protein